MKPGIESANLPATAGRIQGRYQAKLLKAFRARVPPSRGWGAADGEERVRIDRHRYRRVSHSGGSVTTVRFRQLPPDGTRCTYPRSLLCGSPCRSTRRHSRRAPPAPPPPPPRGKPGTPAPRPTGAGGAGRGRRSAAPSVLECDENKKTGPRGAVDPVSAAPSTPPTPLAPPLVREQSSDGENPKRPAHFFHFFCFFLKLNPRWFRGTTSETRTARRAYWAASFERRI